MNFSRRTTISTLLKTPISELVNFVEAALDEDNAEEIIVVDLAGKSSIADYMVVATGRSQRHVASMADKLMDKLKELGVADIAIEGKDQCDWVLLDAGDIIVHLFRPGVRELYNLEKMWAIGPNKSDLALQ
jgi:ribosome-associated protein